MHDRGGGSVGVDAEVQGQLAGRRERPGDDRAVERHNSDVGRRARPERHPGRGDRDEVARPGADVARGADEETGLGEPAGRRGDLGPEGVGHCSLAIRSR
ncbi:hypothetical protein NSI01_51220 [Pimelobacter simplex]|nr:hypothetical protein NSI01_51220 [Pimelobacter simplex]